MSLQRAALLGLTCLIASCQAFYLPGVAPQDYAKVRLRAAASCLGRVFASSVFALVQGDKLNLKVNKLSSTKTQLPYEYYSIPYCRPDPIVSSAENLGEVLRGDRIENSPYEVKCGVYCDYLAIMFMSLHLDDCVVVASRSRSEWTSSARYCAESLSQLCPAHRQRHSPPKLKMSTGSICKLCCMFACEATDALCLHLSLTGCCGAARILDNLPVAIPQIRDDSGSNVKRYERGFPVGRVEVCTCICSSNFTSCCTMSACRLTCFYDAG